MYDCNSKLPHDDLIFSEPTLQIESIPPVKISWENNRNNKKITKITQELTACGSCGAEILLILVKDAIFTDQMASHALYSSVTENRVSSHRILLLRNSIHFPQARRNGAVTVTDCSQDIAMLHANSQ